MACRIARDRFSGDYRRAGEFVHKNIRFTYLYPSSRPDGVENWPWVDRNLFAWRFLHSYASTALADGRSKLDGSLHETELIAHRTRDGASVWLVGAIWIKPEDRMFADDAALAAFLQSLQFGGERSYGWGRIAEARAIPLTEASAVLNDWNWRPDAEFVKLQAGRQSVKSWLPAHTLAQEEQPHWLESGVVEPLVGRVTDPDRASAFGRTLSAGLIAWSPGAAVKGSLFFRVGHFGVWTFESNRQA